MSRILHRQIHGHFPEAVGGEGPYVTDSTGKTYLDACGGAAVSCLGYGDSDVTKALCDQARRMAYVHSSFFTTAPAEELAEFLTERAPEGLDYLYFLSGGSEAVEAAIKLARQYFVEIGQPGRHKVIARWQSYHGNTMGALSAGGNSWRRSYYMPMLHPASIHIDPCYAYRYQAEGESEEAYGRRAADELEKAIRREGSEQIMAFIAEPVVGATAGAVPPAKGYFRRIREICDKYNILLILDEVMCGMGRTGTLFACEQDGISPDLLTVAKGLGGGYQPISSMFLSQKIFRALSEGSGFFQHGHTYMGHSAACATALAVQKKIEDKELLKNVQAQGSYLDRCLREKLGAHPHVGDIRGRGLFRGLELVYDRETKTPFPPQTKLHGLVKKAAFEKGLMCYPAGGTIDGVKGNHVLLAPAFILTHAHIEEIVEKLALSLDTAVEKALAVK